MNEGFKVGTGALGRKNVETAPVATVEPQYQVNENHDSADEGMIPDINDENFNSPGMKKIMESLPEVRSSVASDIAEITRLVQNPPLDTPVAAFEIPREVMEEIEANPQSILNFQHEEEITPIPPVSRPGPVYVGAAAPVVAYEKPVVPSLEQKVEKIQKSPLQDRIKKSKIVAFPSMQKLYAPKNSWNSRIKKAVVVSAGVATGIVGLISAYAFRLTKQEPIQTTLVAPSNVVVPVPEPTAPPVGYVTVEVYPYTIQSGDNLTVIAKRTMPKASAKELLALVDNFALQLGKYSVEKAESMKAKGLRVEKAKDPSYILPGQVLSMSQSEVIAQEKPTTTDSVKSSAYLYENVNFQVGSLRRSYFG